MRALVMLYLVLGMWPVASAQQDSLFWDDARPLTFADYHGRRPPGGERHAASTTCGLYVRPYVKADGGLGWDVLAVFSGARSWVDAWAVRDTALLRHERLHFDLVEVHARELRRFLFTVPLMGTRSEAQKLLAIIADRRALLDAEQAVYDGETVHGTYRAVQERWEREVAARLKALEAYR